MAKYHDTFTEVGKAKAQQIVDAIRALGGKAEIAVTYFDLGQDWTWETILVEDKTLEMKYQALTPKDFRLINEGELSNERVASIIEKSL